MMLVLLLTATTYLAAPVEQRARRQIDEWTTLGVGGCRTATGQQEDSFEYVTVSSVYTCQAVCQANSLCTGIEFDKTTGAVGNCRLQDFEIGMNSGDAGKVACYSVNRYVVPATDPPTTTVAAVTEAPVVTEAPTAPATEPPTTVAPTIPVETDFRYDDIGGCCRTAGGGPGMFNVINNVFDRKSCKVFCNKEDRCVAFEYVDRADRCELHSTGIAYATSDAHCECFVKGEPVIPLTTTTTTTTTPDAEACECKDAWYHPTCEGKQHGCSTCSSTGATDPWCPVKVSPCTTEVVHATDSWTSCEIATEPPLVSSGSAVKKSSKTCNELQWRPKQVHVPAQQGICAQSEVNGECHLVETRDAADAVCKSVGGRLCSAAELHGDVARGTGCELDVSTDPVWTNDDSEDCGVGHAVVAAPSSKARIHTPDWACSTDDTGALAVRCCADDDHSIPNASGANLGYTELGPGNCRSFGGSKAASKVEAMDNTFDECQNGCSEIGASCTGFEWIEDSAGGTRCTTFFEPILSAYSGNFITLRETSPLVARCFAKDATFFCSNLARVESAEQQTPFNAGLADGHGCDDFNDATVGDVCADGACFGFDRISFNSAGDDGAAGPTSEEVGTLIDVVTNIAVDAEEDRIELQPAAASVTTTADGSCEDEANQEAVQASADDFLGALHDSGVSQDEVLAVVTTCENNGARKQRRAITSTSRTVIVFLATPEVIAAFHTDIAKNPELNQEIVVLAEPVQLVSEAGTDVDVVAALAASFDDVVYIFQEVESGTLTVEEIYEEIFENKSPPVYTVTETTVTTTVNATAGPSGSGEGPTCITDASDHDDVAADLFGDASIGCAEVEQAGYCTNGFIAFTCPVACKHLPGVNECYTVGDYEVDQDDILFNQYGATCGVVDWTACMQPAVAMACPVTCAAATSPAPASGSGSSGGGPTDSPGEATGGTGPGGARLRRGRTIQKAKLALVQRQK
jgi:hypothetical protein